MLFLRPVDSQIYWLDPYLRSRGTISDDDGSRFEFAAFLIDVSLTRDELHSRMQNVVLPQLEQHYKPFFELYPFQAEPHEIQLEEFGDGQVYIHGEILCPGGIDADLLFGLLYEFLLAFENLYIHVVNHFLQALEYEGILKEEDLDVSLNRFWVNKGKVLFVSPSVLLPGKSILLDTSLKFLQENRQKCRDCGPIFKDGDKSQYLINALECIVDVKDVRIPMRLARIYYKYPWLISASFLVYYRGEKYMEAHLAVKTLDQEKGIIPPQCRIEGDAESSVALDIGVPDWIAAFVDQLADVPLSEILCEGFNILLNKSVELGTEYELSQQQVRDSEPIDLSRLRLQNRLMSMGRLDGIVEAKSFEFDEERSGVDNLMDGDQEKLMADMTEFLKDEEKVRKLFDMDEREYEEDDDSEDGDDEQAAAAAYFKKEGIDIDEDDFFEFFLRNALHIDKEKLSDYVAEPLPEKSERKRVYNDESDYSSDEAEFPASYRDVVDLEEEYEKDELEGQFANMSTR